MAEPEHKSSSAQSPNDNVGSVVGNSVVNDLMRVYENLTQSSTPQAGVPDASKALSLAYNNSRAPQPVMSPVYPPPVPPGYSIPPDAFQQQQQQQPRTKKSSSNQSSSDQIRGRCADHSTFLQHSRGSCRLEYDFQSAPAADGNSRICSRCNGDSHVHYHSCAKCQQRRRQSSHTTIGRGVARNPEDVQLRIKNVAEFNAKPATARSRCLFGVRQVRWWWRRPVKEETEARPKRWRFCDCDWRRWWEEERKGKKVKERRRAMVETFYMAGGFAPRFRICYFRCRFEAFLSGDDHGAHAQTRANHYGTDQITPSEV